MSELRSDVLHVLEAEAERARRGSGWRWRRSPSGSGSAASCAHCFGQRGEAWGALWVATAPAGRALSGADVPALVRAADDVARALGELI